MLVSCIAYSCTSNMKTCPFQMSTEFQRIK
jgi:hypothetical protein